MEKKTKDEKPQSSGKQVETLENQIDKKLELKDDQEKALDEVRLAVIGNVDSGKSTLVGCLTKNVKDDGRGYARKYVFNYQHETETGRTSSIAEEILGFKNGVPIEAGRLNEKKNVSWKEIYNQADHVITLLDLCGHEKYLKTTMYGLTALLPDYAIILIGTNMGVQRMTKEHLGIVVSLNIPFFIIFTKIDIAPQTVRENTVNTFSTILKNGLQKTVYHVKSEEDAKACSQAIVGGTVVPVFQVSTVTGEGIDFLKKFLADLVPRHSMNNEVSLIKSPDDPVEMLLDSGFKTGVDYVFAGVLTSGTLRVKQTLLMGPLSDGSFKTFQVKTIQFLRVNVDEIKCGNSCSVSLKIVDMKLTEKDFLKHYFRKGMVLVSPENHLTPTREFEIEALIVHHASTIKVGYQSVVHVNVVRQTATIVEMNKECMRAGDTGIIKFQFLKSPEYLHLGDIVLFREGRTRGKGKIIKLYPMTNESQDAKGKKTVAQGNHKKNPKNFNQPQTTGNNQLNEKKKKKNK